MSKIFFYGLFMDRSFLTEKGLHPEMIGPAVLPDYRIHIGEQATLLRSGIRRGDRCFRRDARHPPSSETPTRGTGGPELSSAPFTCAARRISEDLDISSFIDIVIAETFSPGARSIHNTPASAMRREKQ